MCGKAGSVDFILTTNCDIVIGFPTFFPTFLALEVSLSENGIIIVLRPPKPSKHVRSLPVSEPK